MATMILRTARPFRGARRLDPQRELLAGADLIETAFAGAVDPAGQSALRELRWMGRMGSFIGLAVLGAGEWSGLFDGMVWVEDGRVVGNVTLQRADSYARRWQIANVAVAPAYRGRGIARALMGAALEQIASEGGTWAILQVRENNPIARALYEHMGFAAITGTCDLRRPRDWQGLASAPEGLPWEPLSASAWQEAYDLATASLPALATWWQPPRLQRFQLAADQQISEWLSCAVGWGRVWRLGLRVGDRLAAAVAVSATRWQPPHRLEMWVHPDHRGAWEATLVSQSLDLLATYPAQEVAIQVDMEYAALIAALGAAGFQNRRTLITMRRQMGSET